MSANTGDGEAVVVRDALRALGFANVYLVPVATWLCCEPIVVESGEWERETLQADGSERGVRRLTVHVCCDDPGDAEAGARSIADGLLGFDWIHPGFELAEGLRVVACDTGQPVYVGRDSSGRWLWDVPLSMTVVVIHERQD